MQWVTAASMALAGATTGAAVGVLSGLATKVKQENCFMISYLEDDDPENLKLIVLECGKSFQDDAIKFFRILEEQDKTTPKSDIVKAFKEKIEAKEREKAKARKTLKIPEVYSEVKRMKYLFGDGKIYHFSEDDWVTMVEYKYSEIGDMLRYANEQEMVDVYYHDSKVVHIQAGRLDTKKDSKRAGEDNLWDGSNKNLNKSTRR